MIFASLLGLMLIWPACRLCQQAYTVTSHVNARRISRILLDWFAMVVLVQVVIWPMQIAGDWTSLQTGWIAITIAAWSLLTAVILAWGVSGETSARRTGAMALCIALVFGEPLLMWLITAADGPSWFMWVSPIQALWTITMNRADFALYPMVWHVTAAAAAALVAWVLMLVHVVRKS